MPKYVNDWTRVNSVWRGVGEGKMGADQWKDGELNYQERVAVIWIEKVKSMGPCALSWTW